MIRKNVERVVATEEQASKLKKDGFEALEAAASPHTSETGSGKKLEEMNVEELRALAKEKGLTGYASLKKDELLAVLKDVV